VRFSRNVLQGTWISVALTGLNDKAREKVLTHWVRIPPYYSRITQKQQKN